MIAIIDELLTKHNGVSSLENLYLLTYYLLTHAGLPVNPNGISREFERKYNIRVSTQTLRSYLQKLVDAGYFDRIERRILNHIDREDPFLRYTSVYFVKFADMFDALLNDCSCYLTGRYAFDDSGIEIARFRTSVYHRLKNIYDKIYSGKIMTYYKDQNKTVKRSHHVEFVCENDDGYKHYYSCCSDGDISDIAFVLNSIQDARPKTVVDSNCFVQKWTDSGINIIGISELNKKLNNR